VSKFLEFCCSLLQCTRCIVEALLFLIRCFCDDRYQTHSHLEIHFLISVCEMLKYTGLIVDFKFLVFFLLHLKTLSELAVKDFPTP